MKLNAGIVQKMMSITAKDLLATLLVVNLWGHVQALAEPTREQRARNQMVQSLPVLPWVTLGVTTITEALPRVQQMKTQLGGSLLVDQGASVETGGSFINLATALPSGLLNEPGLQMITLDFDDKRRAQMVVLRVDRGWNDKNIAPLLERMSRRYSNLANPTVLGDSQSEATDKTVLFDIGKFAIEVRIPQHGTYATVTFTTKTILKNLRTTDGSAHIFGDILDRM